MDQLDKNILNIIQTGFPMEAKPYAIVGEQVGLTEDETFNRVMKLKEEQVIRRIGATFDSRKLHFKSTLCAAKVDKGRIEEVANIVSTYPEVTHNYERNHNYNLWFTIIAESEERLNQILDEIAEQGKVERPRSMPASKLFKIKVNFKFKDDKKEGAEK